MTLFETHCHLNHERFDADRDEVLARARESGVAELLVIGFDLPSSRRAVDLADPATGLFATVGIHPHDASTWSVATERALRALARRPGVVGWGEIGLDYYRDLSPRDQQREAFTAQAEIALELGLPVVIHTRESVPDTLEVLEGFAARGLRGVLHCWSGTPEEARAVIRMGFHLGIGGVVTYPRSEPLAQAVAEAPSAALLLETDSPYLAPVPHRGRRNEPAYLRCVAERVAQIREASAEVIAAVTRENCRRLFRLLESGVE